MNQRIMAQLGEVGLNHLNELHHNLSTPQLYEHIIQRREGSIAHLGSLIVKTGKHTGRSAKDKYLVAYPEKEGEIYWSEDTQKISPKVFERLHYKMAAFMQSRNAYIQDCFAGADEQYQINVRVITQYAWHSLFARNMFINAAQANYEDIFTPDFTILCAPDFHANPQKDGTKSDTFIMIDLERRLILIGGTGYAGEIKKSIFTVMNYLLPKQDVMSMHCSANIGENGQTALFFGLSGTGKTTLSADSSRQLIGDDEHGWGDDGVFNIEGGCYAKVIRISKQSEPDIFESTRKFGTVMENVAFDSYTRRVDFDDASITENTRACYPIQHIDNIAPKSKGKHPQHIIFLTFDAYGVFPPVAKLDKAQAMYQFLSGYTAKVGGTEKGLKGVKTTFSFAFGAPFMPLKPTRYAELLGEKIDRHDVNCWLVNTGYTGGAYGSEEGHRLSLKYTRRIINAILNNELNESEYEQEEVFGLRIPAYVERVPEDILKPWMSWADQQAYEEKIRELAQQFEDNFEQFSDEADAYIQSGGPRLATVAE